MFRTVFALAGCIALAGCSSTEVANSGAEPYAAPVAATAYAAAPHMPVASYKGYWFVADDTERDCTVEFSAAPRDNGMGDIYAAHPTGECVSSLKHIAGWGLNNGGIVLYDRNGQSVGAFARTDVLNYGGEVTIDTGQTFIATLRKIA